MRRNSANQRRDFCAQWARSAIQKPRDKRPAHLHRTLWTELLTAEAVDAGGAVNSRELVFHFDGLGGTDVRAFAAADAFWRMDAGVGAESSARNGGGDLADDAASDVERCNRLLSLGHVKVGLAQRGIVAAHMQLRRRRRDQTARQCCCERRHIFCCEADQIGAEQVELVRRVRCRDRAEVDGGALRGPFPSMQTTASQMHRRGLKYSFRSMSILEKSPASGYL